MTAVRGLLTAGAIFLAAAGAAAEARDVISPTDHGDLEISVRYRALDADEARLIPAVGVLPFVTVPLADEPIGSGRPDFGVVGLASFELPWRLGLDLNAGIAAIGQSRPGGFLVQGILGALVSRWLTERLSAFTELFFTTREERDGRDMLRFNTGLAWAVARDLALDTAVATSLAGRAPDVELRAGLSFRFGR